MPKIDCSCSICGKSLKRDFFSHVKEHYCGPECRRQLAISRRLVTKDWLIEHYTIKGMDTSQIGRMLGRDPKCVWLWLKGFGIETRKRGHASTKPFKKGERSAFAGKKHSAETRARLREIAISDGRVPYDPEVGPPMKGKRGPETSNWKGGVTPERAAFYSSKEWKAAVYAVKKRDNNTCQICGKVKTAKDGQSFDIHHIVPFSYVPLRSEPSNLIYFCEPCHYWVHGLENTEKKYIKDAPEELASVE